SCERARGEIPQTFALDGGKLPRIWNEPAGGLVSEYAVEKRGHSNGSPHIRTEAEGNNAGTDDGAFATGGTAHDACDVVRIVRAAVDLVVGLHPHAGFGGIRDADGNRAGLTIPGDGCGVFGGAKPDARYDAGGVRHAF